MRKKLKFCAGMLLLALAGGAAQAQTYKVQTVMTGLVNPRGLAFGPDGGVYVAEAGNGSGSGAGPSLVMGSGNTAFLGASGAVSRLLGGVQSRVMTGLPSLATATGGDPGGINDILFDGSGQAWGLIGLGANPMLRASNLGAAGAEMGTLVRLTLDGSSTRTFASDLSAHELANNPDGTTVDSNPFGFALLPGGGFLVADAGSNDVLGVGAGGGVSTQAVFPAKPNPLFPGFGPPVYQSVPTAVAVGPDGAAYIGQLTGFPFPSGAASVYRIDPATQAVTTVQTGFTNIMDMAFDDAGNLFVLQLNTNGIASGPAAGAGVLVRIDAQTGQRTSFSHAAMVATAGLLLGDSGEIYISTRSNGVSGLGEVLMLTPVPEPATLSLWLAGLGLVGLKYRSRRRPCA